MNNLNGGYTMIDLDNTSGIYKKVENAYNSNKPVMVYKDGQSFYVKIEKSGTTYVLYASNGVIYNVASYGVVTTTYLTPKYRHNISISGTIAGSTRTLLFNLDDNNSSTYSISSILSMISSKGYKTSDTPLLVTDTNSIAALIYVSSSGVPPVNSLNTKPVGSTTYSTNAAGTLTATDTVTTIW